MVEEEFEGHGKKDMTVETLWYLVESSHTPIK